MSLFIRIDNARNMRQLLCISSKRVSGKDSLSNTSICVPNGEEILHAIHGFTIESGRKIRDWKDLSSERGLVVVRVIELVSRSFE